MNLEALRRRCPGRRIDYYDSLPTTMHAAAGLPPGSVVVAGEQTAGQGRHGHAWHSEPRAGLYCSIVLDLPQPTPAITLALGLATADAIAETTGLACDLRWPNDLMHDDRKLAGILVQPPVAGIGINVNHQGFPPDLAPIATSIRLATGHEFAREDVLAALLPAIDQWVMKAPATVIQAFTARSTYADGKSVTADLPEGPVAGVTAGLDPTGFLRLRRPDGTETLILAGGVRENVAQVGNLRPVGNRPTNRPGARDAG